MIKKRVTALQALVYGSRLGMNQQAVCSNVHNEFEQVLKAIKIPLKPRRYLLQVLHSTRALDTSLRELTAILNPQATSNSLGGYLRDLQVTRAGNWGFSHNEVNHFQTEIVTPRNKFMHRAGTFPTNTQVEQLLSSMDACLQRAMTF